MKNGGWCGHGRGGPVCPRPFPFYTPNTGNRWVDMVRADTSVRPYKVIIDAIGNRMTHRSIFDLPFSWHELFVVHDLHDAPFLSQNKQAMSVSKLIGVVFDNDAGNRAV